MSDHPTIDLNCDLGEGAGHDAAVMPLISSANIASGAHAGDRQSITETVALARGHGVAVGCHPGHADPASFGRRPLPISPAAAADLVAGQLTQFAAIAGDSLRHVKLHGALYHQVGHVESLATAVARRLAVDWPQLLLFAATGSRLAEVAAAEGLRVAAEAFADRRYDAGGRLVARTEPGALITAPADAASQAVAIVATGACSVGGGSIRIRPATLCVHGDGAAPADCLLAIRAALSAAGIGIAPPFSTGRS